MEVEEVEEVEMVEEVVEEELLKPCEKTIGNCDLIHPNLPRTKHYNNHASFFIPSAIAIASYTVDTTVRSA